MPVQIKEPDAPATPSQTFFIRRLSGEDVRPQNLTRQQASDMIQSLLEKQSKEPKADKPKFEKSVSVDYAKIMQEASDAANKAGDEWWNERCSIPFDTSSPAQRFGMLDLCGFAHIIISDKRTKFAKWYLKNNPRMGNAGTVQVSFKYQPRQEIGLREECLRAALDVLRKHDIEGLSFESRLD
jgi:hypothetical protein